MVIEASNYIFKINLLGHIFCIVSHFTKYTIIWKFLKNLEIYGVGDKLISLFLKQNLFIILLYTAFGLIRESSMLID